MNESNIRYIYYQYYHQKYIHTIYNPLANNYRPETLKALTSEELNEMADDPESQYPKI